MRTIRFLLAKEFRQIFRNKSILAMIIVMPVMQLILLPLAADYEVKNINLAIVDHDHSPYAQKLVQSIVGSGYFRLIGYEQGYPQAIQLIEADKADLVLEIPAGFERKLVRENEAGLLVAVNAINGAKANLGGNYLTGIIRKVNAQIRLDMQAPERYPNLMRIDVQPVNWFNRYLNYQMYMVPGILAILVTMIGGFLSALNIVKEKEIGTIEQINVTPIKKHHFILGKLIPFWVLGNVVFTLGLLVSYIIYGIVPQGNLLVMYAYTGVYLLAVLGFGLWISTFCDTQQQAMFIMYFFMIVFILMGGLFTSTDSMPAWARFVSACTPVSYFIQVMRLVVLKGSGFADITYHLLMTALFALILNTIAVFSYRKTS